jgi:hypothetical protein
MRWSRSQHFSLSPTGIVAQAAYVSTIVTSRTQGGRASFDAARGSWAETFHVQPDDGLYLGELQNGSVRLKQIVEALETSGKTHTDALAALERLVDAGFVSTSEM